MTVSHFIVNDISYFFLIYYEKLFRERQHYSALQRLVPLSVALRQAQCDKKRLQRIREKGFIVSGKGLYLC
jgi:hypothetical protein